MTPATTPPPAAERIEMIRTAEAAALDYLMAHGGRWIEGTNRLFLDDTKYEMAELIGVVLDVVAPPQDRPSREDVANVIWRWSQREDGLWTVPCATEILALFPSSPQPATADAEVQP